MKVKILMMSCGIFVLASACNNGTESKASTTDSAKVTTDSTATMSKDSAKVAEAPPPVDSAAITREYLAARNKAKKPAVRPKKQGKNEVEMYSETPMPTHEALEQPPAAKNATTVVIHTKEYVYFAPSQKPSFPGGDQALTAYINKNIVYPDDALRYNIGGTVFAEVYLDSLGNVTKVEIPGTHLGGGLEEETKSLLMGSPRWHPAKENGQMVRSKVTVPVTFKIDN